MDSKSFKHHVNTHFLFMHMENNKIPLSDLFTLVGVYLVREIFGPSDPLPIACSHLWYKILFGTKKL